VLPLAGLYLTYDPNQMKGIAPDEVLLDTGESKTLYARGQSSIDTDGQWFVLPPDVVVSWRGGQGVEVTPTEGQVVTVKVTGPLPATGFVQVQATTTDYKGHEVRSYVSVENKKH